MICGDKFNVPSTYWIVLPTHIFPWIFFLDQNFVQMLQILILFCSDHPPSRLASVSRTRNVQWWWICFAWLCAIVLKTQCKSFEKKEFKFIALIWKAFRFCLSSTTCIQIILSSSEFEPRWYDTHFSSTWIGSMMDYRL